MPARAIESATAADLLEVDREVARRELLPFTQYTFPEYRPGWFAVHLAAKLDKFLDDCMAELSPRLMIYAPPRHGKSELVSRRLPAFALGRNPDTEVITASYSGNLAGKMSRAVERIVMGARYRELFPATAFPRSGLANPEHKVSSVELREVLDHKGSYRAAGVREGITGEGAGAIGEKPGIFLIDDPVKDATDARSMAVRDATWEWYLTTAYSRLGTGAGMCLVMTRWNVDDLAGRLREAEQADEGDAWDVVEFPAIAERDEPDRKQGEALDETRYPLTRLLQIQKALKAKPWVWASLYQQRPTVLGGTVFKDAWWEYYDPKVLPRFRYRRIYADTAQKTKEANDYSVFQCWAMGWDGRIYLLDQIRDRWEAPELLRVARDFWRKWAFKGPNLEVTQAMCIEDKSSGTGLIQQLRRTPKGRGGEYLAIPVRAIPRHLDKAVRATNGSPYIEAGHVVLPEYAPFLSDYKGEFSAFNLAMSHPHDDQVDPTLDAIDDMLGGTANLYDGAV